MNRSYKLRFFKFSVALYYQPFCASKVLYMFAALQPTSFPTECSDRQREERSLSFEAWNPVNQVLCHSAPTREAQHAEL